MRRASLVGAVGAAAVAAGVAACGEPGIRMDAATMRLSIEAETAATWVPTTAEPVSVALDVPPSVREGSEVPVRITVHNGSDRPLSIGFGQRHGFDVLVVQGAAGRADSTPVWSPMQFGALKSDAVVTDPVAPGRDTVMSIVWPLIDAGGAKVPPGAYRIRASVSANLVSARRMWTDWKPIQVEP